MKRGNGELTYNQLWKQNKELRKQIEKLRADYNSLKIANNKLLKEVVK